MSKHAEGSCLVKFGDTGYVLCIPPVDEQSPPWLRGSGKGWVTAEYGMLPRSTNTRTPREAAKGGQSGRTQEIQRLIGRALRAVTDMKAFGEVQIRLDCDVLQADGGTRCASICGSYIALAQAFATMKRLGAISRNPLREPVAAVVSCGLVQKSTALLDLDYRRGLQAPRPTPTSCPDRIGQDRGNPMHRRGASVRGNRVSRAHGAWRGTGYRRAGDPAARRTRPLLVSEYEPPFHRGTLN